MAAIGQLGSPRYTIRFGEAITPSSSEMGGHGMNNLVHLPEHVTGWICVVSEGCETASSLLSIKREKEKRESV